MKTFRIFIVLSAIFALLGCHKGEVLPLQTDNIPNGDFENWGQYNTLDGWKTTYCPMCSSPVNSYTVQKSTDAYHGKYAAMFTYNGAFAAMASNKFAVNAHPANLTAFVKYEPYGTDTVSIKIKLFNSGVAVDSGAWTGIAAIPAYRGLSIAVTHHSLSADSALITIKGGTKWDTKGKGTVLWVDYLLLH